MQIELPSNLSIDDRIYIKELEKYMIPPVDQIILFDTNILLPAIFPKKRRKPGVITDLMERFHQPKNYRSKMYQRKQESKRIEVINSIENGYFQDLGIYPGITNNVYGELQHFQEVLGLGNSLIGWRKKFEDKLYGIFISIEDTRKLYPSLSKIFKENADFSIAISSYLLGCDFATDDYNSFNRHVMKEFKRIYQERWKDKKIFLRHDSSSLLMLLNKPKVLLNLEIKKRQA